MLLYVRNVTNNTRFHSGVLLELKTFKFLLTSELGQTFSTVLLMSLIPVLLATVDKTGSLLSISSITSNLITIFLLPYLITKKEHISTVNFMLLIRFSLLLSCFTLMLFQSPFTLVALHALLILLVSMQHVNRNHLLVTFGGGVQSSNLFRFEIGESVIVLLAALTLYLIGDLTDLAVQQILGWNIFLTVTLITVLFLKTRTRAFRMIFNNNVTVNASTKNTLSIKKRPITTATKLEFSRSNIAFLFQRLLWFIVPLWFVHHERAYDFFAWLLISGLGTLVAAILLKCTSSCQKNYYSLFNFCNVLIVISMIIMLFHTNYITLCFAGVVANLAAPVHRSYSRVLAQSKEYNQIPSSDLLAQGISIVRVIHLVLMLIFPFTLSDKYFGWPIAFSLLAILLLINANNLHTKYRSIFQ
jgi:hypothetical protein